MTVLYSHAQPLSSIIFSRENIFLFILRFLYVLAFISIYNVRKIVYNIKHQREVKK
nr:MAG TPA: hypothetical protein [Caudoviricetes sp.]